MALRNVILFALALAVITVVVILTMRPAQCEILPTGATAACHPGLPGPGVYGPERYGNPDYHDGAR